MVANKIGHTQLPRDSIWLASIIISPPSLVGPGRFERETVVLQGITNEREATGRSCVTHEMSFDLRIKILGLEVQFNRLPRLFENFRTLVSRVNCDAQPLIGLAKRWELPAEVFVQDSLVSTAQFIARRFVFRCDSSNHRRDTFPVLLDQHSE